MCPGRHRPLVCTGNGGPGAWTDYFINSFVNDANGLPSARDNKRTMTTLGEGGASQTILLGHGQINPNFYANASTSPGYTDIVFNGGSPGMCRPNTIIENAVDSIASKPGNWGGPFPEGSLMGMADGGVRTFPYSFVGGVIADGEISPPLDVDWDGHHLFGRFLIPFHGHSQRAP
jgi:hypothetical protein